MRLVLLGPRSAGDGARPTVPSPTPSAGSAQQSVNAVKADWAGPGTKPQPQGSGVAAECIHGVAIWMRRKTAAIP